MWQDQSVSWHYWSSHIAIYGCYQLNTLYLSNLHTVMCQLYPNLKKKKRKETCFLTVLDTRSLKLRCQQGCTPSQGCSGDAFLDPSSFRWLQAFLDHITLFSLPLSSQGVLDCVSPIFLCLSLITTLVIGFRAHVDDSGCSHLKIRNYIPFLKLQSHSQVPDGCIF